MYTIHQAALSRLMGVMAIVFIIYGCHKSEESQPSSLQSHIASSDQATATHQANPDDIQAALSLTRIYLKKNGVVSALAVALSEADRSFEFADPRDIEIRNGAKADWLFTFYKSPRSIDSEISIAVKGQDVTSSMEGLMPGMMHWDAMFKEQSFEVGDTNNEIVKINTLLQQSLRERGVLKIDQLADSDKMNGLVVHLALSLSEAEERWNLDAVWNLDGRMAKNGAWLFRFYRPSTQSDGEIWVGTKESKVVLSMKSADRSISSHVVSMWLEAM